MDDEDLIQKEVEQSEIVVEKEWSRIERLLSLKNQPACNMAVVEADKLFREVLGVVSYGGNADEAIHNVANMFSNMKGLLEARKVYDDIVEVPGFWLDQSSAKKITAIYLQGILDLLGKDYQEKSWGQKIFNDIVYFGETHPKLWRDILIGFIAFLVTIWFLADTFLGQWIVGLAVGLTHFVLSWVWWLLIILIVVLLVVTISWLMLDKQRQ